jgi:hypothetical protein
MATCAVIVALAGLLGGCASARNELVSHDSVCFRVYPEALAAVHHHGRFAGARYLPPRALIVEKHRVGVPDALSDAARVATCLVAFTGHFTASSVESGWAPSGTPGQIAIVVIQQRNSALVATVVLSRMPRPLVFARLFPSLK